MSENQSQAAGSADPRGEFGGRPPTGASSRPEGLPESGGSSGSASHGPGNAEPSYAEPEGPRAERAPRQQPPGA
jgi:hypothetical protein